MNRIELKTYGDGEINLQEKAIEFNDKSSRTNIVLFKILPFLFLIFGIYQIYTGIKAEKERELILRILTGILILSFLILSYHSNLKRTNKGIIELNEIKDVKMKKIFGEILIDFKLKDNSTRRVYNIKSIADWNLIKTYLTERNIKCLN